MYTYCHLGFWNTSHPSNRNLDYKYFSWNPQSLEVVRLVCHKITDNHNFWMAQHLVTLGGFHVSLWAPKLVMMEAQITFTIETKDGSLHMYQSCALQQTRCLVNHHYVTWEKLSFLVVMSFLWGGRHIVFSRGYPSVLSFLLPFPVQSLQ